MKHTAQFETSKHRNNDAMGRKIGGQTPAHKPATANFNEGGGM